MVLPHSFEVPLRTREPRAIFEAFQSIARAPHSTRVRPAQAAELLSMSDAAGGQFPGREVCVASEECIRDLGVGAHFPASCAAATPPGGSSARRSRSSQRDAATRLARSAVAFARCAYRAWARQPFLSNARETLQVEIELKSVGLGGPRAASRAAGAPKQQRPARTATNQTPPRDNGATPGPRRRIEFRVRRFPADAQLQSMWPDARSRMEGCLARCALQLCAPRHLHCAERADNIARAPYISLTVCPSGLRGWTQVPLAQAAWVQIPQLSLGLDGRARQTWRDDPKRRGRAGERRGNATLRNSHARSPKQLGF